MGDRRFDAAYKAVAEAPDRVAAIAGLDDEEVVHALAAASRKMDAYLANVLAVEVLNRRRRQRALLWAVIAGLGTAVALRTAIFLVYSSDRVLLWVSLAAFLPAAAMGVGVYVAMMRRPH